MKIQTPVFQCFKSKTEYQKRLQKFNRNHISVIQS